MCRFVFLPLSDIRRLQRPRGGFITAMPDRETSNTDFFPLTEHYLQSSLLPVQIVLRQIPSRAEL